MTPQEFAADYNWQAALEYNGSGFTPTPVEGYAGDASAFGFDDIAQVVMTSDGENDGAEWLAALRLNDGRFIFVEAGCDYTGWD